MWIFLTEGFLSIVQDRKDPRRLLVRARTRSHLESVFPKAEVQLTEKADYRFRASVSREEVADRVREAVMDLSYGNFKDTIRDEAYHDACMGVWNEMCELQENIRRSEREEY